MRGFIRIPVSSSGVISTSPIVRLCIGVLRWAGFYALNRRRSAQDVDCLFGGTSPGHLGHCLAEPMDSLFNVFHGDIAEGEPDVVRGDAIREKLRALPHNHRALVR